jgi:hypothetical protein
MANSVMTKTASATALDLELRAEEVILERLRGRHEPVDPTEIIVSQPDQPISQRVLLFALWNLARDGRVQFTPEWKVRVVG